ncbi:hypothetical protein JCM3774_001285 [Rhodotorula dairenensis]
MDGYSSLPQAAPGPSELSATRPRLSSDSYADKPDSDVGEEKEAASDARLYLRDSAHRVEIRALLRAQQRKQLTQFLVLLLLAVAGITFTLHPTDARIVRVAVYNNTTVDGSRAIPLELPQMLVGQRPRFAADGKPVYRSCGYDDLLKSIKGATIRPDGLSRRPSYSHVNYVHLDPFEWSFDLPGIGKADGGGAEAFGSDYTVDIQQACAPMHVYTQAEACELLGAYGGLYASGDSYVRHLYTALMMILRNRNDGAVRDRETTDDCRHEQAFDDGKLCRDRINVDTNYEEHVCGNAAQVGYVLMYWPEKNTYNIFRDWRSRLPRTHQLLSPVFIAGLGLHFGFNTSVEPWHEWLNADTEFMNRQNPRPAKIFLGPHKPGQNQQEQWIPVQGPQRLAPYKEEVIGILAGVSESTLPHEGSWRYLDTWRMSEGAVSYDGSHFSYQVNMEKANIILNLLDVLWGDIVAAGGLVTLRPT